MDFYINNYWCLCLFYFILYCTVLVGCCCDSKSNRSPVRIVVFVPLVINQYCTCCCDKYKIILDPSPIANDQLISNSPVHLPNYRLFRHCNNHLSDTTMKSSRYVHVVVDSSSSLHSNTTFAIWWWWRNILAIFAPFIE